MPPQLLLRVFIYGLGLHAAYSGISQLVYYLHTGLTAPGWQTLASPVLAFVVTPLMIALACLGFGRGIVTSLLGPEGQAPLQVTSADSDVVLRLLLKSIGVYVAATTIGHAVATVYEFIAVKNGNPRFDEAQVMTDLIANGIALAVAFVLTAQTDKVMAQIKANDKGA